MTNTKTPRTAAATLAAAAAAKRRKGRRLAKELAELDLGYSVRPPEADPVPAEPGVYVSDTLHEDPRVAAAGAALGTWTMCLLSPARQIIGGLAAVPARMAHERFGGSGTIEALVQVGLWSHDTTSGCYLFNGAGDLYAIVGREGQGSAPNRGN